jgi:hypothetical protein
MKKVLLVFFCTVVMVLPGHLCLAQEESKGAQQKEHQVNKEIKEASKVVAKESRNIFRKTGKAGKGFWRAVKEGFKETK